MHAIDATGEAHVLTQANKRFTPPPRDLTDRAARRRRDLAVLALREKGFHPGDIAVWFNLSLRHVNRVTERAAAAATKMGFIDAARLGRTTKGARV